MKVLKIFLGVLLIIGMLGGGIPTLLQDISTGVDGAVIFGEVLGMLLICLVIYYLFSSAGRAENKSSQINKND